MEIATSSIALIRSLFNTEAPIPLHAPTFSEIEKRCVMETIESTMVSSVGEYVTRFEESIAGYLGARHAVATVNGTAALHLALMVAGVRADDEVITSPLTFVATSNAIRYCNAFPVFLDVEPDSFGLSPERTRQWLEQHATMRSDACYNRQTGRRISACVPVHILGHLAQVETLQEICREYGITMVEDAAEALGSITESGRHAGTVGTLGTLSFNGNKIITCGGGGMVVTDDAELAQWAKHLSTTAKLTHPWRYEHDQLGYNYRLPNLNAALGYGQMQRLDDFLEKKRSLHEAYRQFFKQEGYEFFEARTGTQPNHWLNCVFLRNREERDAFMENLHAAGIFVRPLWELMTSLPMYQNMEQHALQQARYLMDRCVCLPSSVPC